VNGPPELTSDELGRRFPNATLTGAMAFELAEQMVKWCPPGRELSLALTKLEESLMWAMTATKRV
jgi:hypothetical protein